MAHDEIAMALGIARNTLEKHFSAELMQKACEKRLEVLDAMQRTALKGNVAAQKAYLATSGPGVFVAPPSEEPKPAELGKKQRAHADAKIAQTGTGWEGLLPNRQLQ